ncbi:endonuclease-reverse transcriptase [Elysia marginata]|uniref:Endonuclease-reverse transcriptase n=1 Tax=Elysia marginata TaxID=1093978 RepID=A0AAV4JF26_9GAST|nr:endonuclease-reverse transcriptase [Elysia marginata]
MNKKKMNKNKNNKKSKKKEKDSDPLTSKMAIASYLIVQTLSIIRMDHVTNESVRELVVAYVGPQEPLLATVKRRKLAWFGHVTRHDSLSKTILQGTVEGKRRRGRQKKAWCDNIKEWTGMAMYELVSSASDRDAWRQKTASSALRSPATTPQVEGLRRRRRRRRNEIMGNSQKFDV